MNHRFTQRDRLTMWHSARGGGRHACVNQGGVDAAAARREAGTGRHRWPSMKVAGAPGLVSTDPIRRYSKFLTTSLR